MGIYRDKEKQSWHKDAVMKTPRRMAVEVWSMMDWQKGKNMG